ncbi:MAG: AIR synthase family protein [Nitrospirota bacterium]
MRARRSARLNALPAGKLPVSLLRRLLAQAAPRGTGCVVVGPGIGLDAAVLDWGGRYLVAKTDPITFVSEGTGAYALTINANDLAVMGATPRWFLATILLPAGKTTGATAAKIFTQLAASCRRLDVRLIGGHTEITTATARPVIVGCLLGDCPKGRLVTAAGARIGDAVLLTKGIPIEAVSILARERAGELRRRYGVRFAARCRRYLDDPGISVLEDARLALAAGGVHAMHDPTEGGLSTALYELAEASKVGLRIEERAIPVLPEGARLCADCGLDPLGAIASGSLLICAAPRSAPAILRCLTRAGIAAAHIGTIVPAREGVRLVTDGRRPRPLPRFAVDEIARLLDQRGSAPGAR